MRADRGAARAPGLTLAATLALGPLAMVSLGGSVAAADGKTVYAELCAACHQPKGEGAAGVAPPLKSAVVKAVAAKNRDYVPLVVLNGLSGRIETEGQVFDTVMPPQSQLTDREIAEVATYVYRTIVGVKGAKVDAATVAALRGTPKTAADLRAMRGGGS